MNILLLFLCLAQLVRATALKHTDMNNVKEDSKRFNENLIKTKNYQRINSNSSETNLSNISNAQDGNSYQNKKKSANTVNTTISKHLKRKRALKELVSAPGHERQMHTSINKHGAGRMIKNKVGNVTKNVSVKTNYDDASTSKTNLPSIPISASVTDDILPGISEDNLLQKINKEREHFPETNENDINSKLNRFSPNDGKENNIKGADRRQVTDITINRRNKELITELISENIHNNSNNTLQRIYSPKEDTEDDLEDADRRQVTDNMKHNKNKYQPILVSKKRPTDVLTPTSFDLSDTVRDLIQRINLLHAQQETDRQSVQSLKQSIDSKIDGLLDAQSEVKETKNRLNNFQSVLSSLERKFEDMGKEIQKITTIQESYQQNSDELINVGATTKTYETIKTKKYLAMKLEKPQFIDSQRTVASKKKSYLDIKSENNATDINAKQIKDEILHLKENMETLNLKMTDYANATNKFMRKVEKVLKTFRSFKKSFTQMNDFLINGKMIRPNTNQKEEIIKDSYDSRLNRVKYELSDRHHEHRAQEYEKRLDLKINKSDNAGTILEEENNKNIKFNTKDQIRKQKIHSQIEMILEEQKNENNELSTTDQFRKYENYDNHLNLKLATEDTSDILNKNELVPNDDDTSTRKTHRFAENKLDNLHKDVFLYGKDLLSTATKTATIWEKELSQMYSDTTTPLVHSSSFLNKEDDEKLPIISLSPSATSTKDYLTWSQSDNSRLSNLLSKYSNTGSDNEKSDVKSQNEQIYLTNNWFLIEEIDKNHNLFRKRTEIPRTTNPNSNTVEHSSTLEIDYSTKLETLMNIQPTQTSPIKQSLFKLTDAPASTDALTTDDNQTSLEWSVNKPPKSNLFDNDVAFIRQMEDRITILENSMSEMQAVNFPQGQDTINTLPTTKIYDVKQNHMSQTSEGKQNQMNQTSEVKQNQTNQTPEVKQNQMNQTPEVKQNQMNQPSDVKRELETYIQSQISDLTDTFFEEKYVTENHTSLREVITRQDFEIKEMRARVEQAVNLVEKLTNQTHTRLPKIHEDTAISLSKLHERVRNDRLKGERFYRSLQGFMIRLNNTAQDLREEVEHQGLVLKDQVAMVDKCIFQLQNADKFTDKVVRSLLTNSPQIVSLMSKVGHLQRELDNLALQVPQDCHDYFLRGFHESGIYVIRPSNSERTVRILCVMTRGQSCRNNNGCLFSNSAANNNDNNDLEETMMVDKSRQEVDSDIGIKEINNGGWTVLQKRTTGKVNFERTWNDYVNGFGELENEYWAGNEVIHLLSTQKPYQLRFVMVDIFSTTWEASYEKFIVTDKEDNYRIYIDGYHGNASDTMSMVNSSAFSTVDFDNDGSSSHCAKFNGGGWWYSGCNVSNLNGRYDVGMVWFNRGWQDWLQLRSSVMMIRPRDITENNV